MERVTRTESSKARQFATNILQQLHSSMREKYIFTANIVGSAVWNTIIKDKNGYWDVDYQILLTRKSKEYKESQLSNATQIKNDFFNWFNNRYKDDINIKVENSTTAITLINRVEKYSIDFVIIRLFPENNEIIRRNNQRQSTKNEFTWNKLPQFNNAYLVFENMSAEIKKDLIENHILPRKDKEKMKRDNDLTKKSSCEIFIEEINNYENRRSNNRL